MIWRATLRFDRWIVFTCRGRTVFPAPLPDIISRMNKALARSISIVLIFLTVTSQNWATCGGGGGGGVGGMGGGNSTQVYQVPWRVQSPKDPPVTSGLVLYW